MWKMLEPDFLPRPPIMLKVPSDTWYGNRDAFWLIDGEIYRSPQVEGVFAGHAVGAKPSGGPRRLPRSVRGK